VAAMRIRGLLGASLIIFFSAVLLASAPIRISEVALGQETPPRSQFYALKVVSEKNVQNAKDSLGAPDGHTAEILPGGELILLMEDKLYPFPIEGTPYVRLADSGSVVGKGGSDLTLEGWLPSWDERGWKQHYWVPLALSATGFCIWITGEGVDLIRITNPGTKSVFVDAVVGYRKEPKGK
jgi:hypothetical protein